MKSPGLLNGIAFSPHSSHTLELARRRCSAEFRFREGPASESEFRATWSAASGCDRLPRECEKCRLIVGTLRKTWDLSKLGVAAQKCQRAPSRRKVKLLTLVGIDSFVDARVLKVRKHLTWLSPTGRKRGNHASEIFVDELGGKMNWTVRQAEHREMPTTRYGMPWEEGARDIAPADALVPSLRVLEALLAGENYTTGEDGHAAVRALVAAHVSDEQQHRVVRLDEALPENQIFPWA